MTLLFEELLLKELIKYKNKKILVAFSGGKDSLALLDFVNKNKDNLNLKLGACHFKHGLRETALRDEVFCKEYCFKNNIEFYGVNIAEELKNDKSGGVESAARKYRYKYLFKILNSNSYDFIFTAHTYSDNIESFFVDLYTGASIYTISGILEENNKIIRPMLNISTDLVNEYLEKHNITPVYDETNGDIKYVRNKVRHKLIPCLYECGNEFEKSVIRLQKESLKLNEYFYLKTKHVIISIDNMALLSKDKFERLEDMEKEFLLGKVFSIFFRVTKNIIYETLLFFSGNHSKRLDLPNGYMVEQSFNNIRVFHSSMVEDYCIKKDESENIIKTDDFIVEFSKDFANKSLVLRNRIKGDKLNNKKVKDLFINKHIELFHRDRAVIIEDCSNGKIIWVEYITNNDNIKIKRMV